jgi:hypothetical protein
VLGRRAQPISRFCGECIIAHPRAGSGARSGAARLGEHAFLRVCAPIALQRSTDADGADFPRTSLAEAVSPRAGGCTSVWLRAMKKQGACLSLLGPLGIARREATGAKQGAAGLGCVRRRRSGGG